MAAAQPGPMVQMPGMLQVQQQGQGAPPPAQVQPQEPPKSDNISKVKSLICPLKDALSNCMRVAAANIVHNASVDAGLKGGDQQPPRFDKCLEDFYAICDQIELNLKVALDCSNLASCSQRYTPFIVAANKPDGSNTTDSYSYGQLISTVKIQVAHAKEIHDSLTIAAARPINNND